jgi:autotransporter-associated beta strand protein
MTTRGFLLLHIKAALLLMAVTAANIALAQSSYTFVHDTDATGNWDDPANWTGGPAGTYPNGVGTTALINQPIKDGTGLYTLTLPATDVTVGQITMDNTGFTNTTRTTIASSGGQLIFQTSSGTAKYIETPNTGTAPANTQNQLSANVLVNSDLEITQNNYPNLNTGTIFGGVINGAANRTITKKGIGGIQFNYSFALGATEGFLGQLIINEGAVRTINSTSTISKMSGMTVNSGGQLQLADNAGTAVPDYNLGAGAVLNLNGNGTLSGGNSADGALRIGIQNGRTTTFHNPVNLQSDAHLNVATTGSFGVLDQTVSGPGDLIKTGTGQLTLTGNIAYTGDTQINAGILSILDPGLSLADNADVYVTTGSTFDLNFSGTDTVRSLFFNDGVVGNVAQTPGKYGAVGNGSADFQVSWITGSGLLNVATLPVTANADFNGDGLVDGADFLVWQKNFGAAGGHAQGDANGDNTVNAADLAVWQGHFGGISATGAATAIPEPAAAMLAVVAACGLARFRRS